MSTSAIENLSISEKLSDIQTTKTAIREAIVAKGVDMPDGTTFRQYSNKIEDIIGVPALSNPGSAGDLRSGKQLAGADGSVVTGTMPETAGKTVTPGTTNQTAVASGRYTTGDVVVAGDANLVPENIAEGVSIFGVDGTHSGGGISLAWSLLTSTAFFEESVYPISPPASCVLFSRMVTRPAETKEINIVGQGETVSTNFMELSLNSGGEALTVTRKASGSAGGGQLFVVFALA